MAQAKQDMGSGSVKKLMLQLMIPAVVAQVVNLLYNIVDRIYIGHIEGIGAAALTGVGLFTPILMLLNAFAMLVGAGIVFQQFYDNLLHLVARKSFGKIALNFSNWNHKLRVTRLYTWRLGGHNMLDFFGCQHAFLAGLLEFLCLRQ